MKSVTVHLLEGAIADLMNIAHYIAEESGSIETALAFTNRIERRCHKIGDAPNGGAPRPDLGKDIRLVPFEKSAVIIYRVIEEAVEIVSVFYGGRDYEAILGDKSSDR